MLQLKITLAAWAFRSARQVSKFLTTPFSGSGAYASPVRPGAVLYEEGRAQSSQRALSNVPFLASFSPYTYRVTSTLHPLHYCVRNRTLRRFIALLTMIDR